MTSRPFFRISLLGVVLAFGAVGSQGAEWRGFWGGQSIYPETEQFERGRWEEPPVCWAFDDGGLRPWSEVEKALIRTALGEWNEAESHLRRRIFEASEPACRGRPVDILLRWESDSSFFKNWGDPNRDGLPLNASQAVGFYVPERMAPPLQIEPCPDLKAAGVLERCSVVFLNADNPNGWFVDSTPHQDEEFEPTTVTLCGEPQTVLRAKRGGPADGKQDLYTVILHEFGHALGLVHSGGCDRNPFTGHPQDDDGAVMWEGFLTQRRDVEDIVIGLRERRHVGPLDRRSLQTVYPPSAPGLEASFPSGGRTPKGIAVGSLLIANNESGTVTRLDPATGQIEALFPVGTFPVDITVDRENQRAYVANFGSGDVTVLDLKGNRVLGRLAVGEQPAALAFDSDRQRLYVALFGEDALAVFDPSTGHRMATIPMPEPLDVVLAPDGVLGYAVARLAATRTQETGGVLTLDLKSFDAIYTLRIEKVLRQLAISPDGRRLFVSARPNRGGRGLLLAIPTEPGTGLARAIEAEVPVGTTPYGVATSADGCFVGVTNLDSHDVTVVDARRLQPLATLKDPAARGPFGIAVAGSRAYVTNFRSHTVSVFELGACP